MDVKQQIISEMKEILNNRCFYKDDYFEWYPLSKGAWGSLSFVEEKLERDLELLKTFEIDESDAIIVEEINEILDRLFR